MGWVLWHAPLSDFTGSAQNFNPCDESKYHSFLNKLLPGAKELRDISAVNPKSEHYYSMIFFM